MMRKNIFQVLQEHFDIEKEIERIETLFESRLFYDKSSRTYSPESLVDKFVFYDWKQRNRCLDTEDLKEVVKLKRRWIKTKKT